MVLVLVLLILVPLFLVPCSSRSSRPQVRERPLYHLIRAQAQQQAGELQGAVQTLQKALSLPGVRRAGSSSRTGGGRPDLSPSDAVSIFLELAQALWHNGEQVETLTTVLTT